MFCEPPPLPCEEYELSVASSELEYLPLEEQLPGDLESWIRASLQHAIGQHGMLIRNDSLADFRWRDLFRLLCGNRYRPAAECMNGAPAGTEYVVCMNEAEVEKCLSSTGPSVTPLLGFQMCIANYWIVPNWASNLQRVAFAFGTPNCTSSPHSGTAIDPYFLYEMPNLTHVDFRGVRGITSIGSFFLACNCENRNLKTIDLSPLCGVTRIDDQFLPLPLSGSLTS